MPHIKRERRTELRGKAIYLGLNAGSAGELNYVITTILTAYLQGGQEANYEDYNRVLGVLEAVKLYLFTRLVLPYESRKRRENGDVFDIRTID